MWLKDRALVNGKAFSVMKSAVLYKAVPEICDGSLAVLLSGADMSVLLYIMWVWRSGLDSSDCELLRVTITWFPGWLTAALKHDVLENFLKQNRYIKTVHQFDLSCVTWKCSQGEVLPVQSECSDARRAFLNCRSSGATNPNSPYWKRLWWILHIGKLLMQCSITYNTVELNKYQNHSDQWHTLDSCIAWQ